MMKLSQSYVGRFELSRGGTGWQAEKMKATKALGSNATFSN